MASLTRKDIFLDFLSPDNNHLYGTYANFAKNRPGHLELLEKALNVAALLCGERCLLPPFFPMQCEVARAALESKADYVLEGLIVFPVRESSLDEFLAKKMEEYSSVRSTYRGLYAPSGQQFLERHGAAVVKRTAPMGSSIAARWETGPDHSPVWRPVLKLLGSEAIETVRKVPRLLKEDGNSVTWAGMQKFLPRGSTRATFELNQALQHEYTTTYLKEYDATIVTRLPPKTTDLLIGQEDLSYDYICLRGVMMALRLWPALAKMAAGDVLRLRSSYGYMEFLRVFHDACRRLATAELVTRVFSAGVFQLRNYGRIGHLPEMLDHDLSHKTRLSQKLMDSIGEYFAVISAAATSVRNDASQPATRAFAAIERRPAMAKIFLVHGHDHAVRDKVNLFLKGKGFEVVVMEDEAWAGSTIPEKFEKTALTCDYVIVVATPDDLLTYRKTGKLVARLRQNVVLEIGYFWGLFGRKDRLSLLLRQDDTLELPSDLAGLGYIPITSDLGETKLRLLQELTAAGLPA